MARTRLRAKGRREGGTFSAWPHACHEAASFKGLSLPARALLFEFLGQLRRANNGDLACAFALLQPRGWRARATIERARQELEAAGWIVRTRQGGRNAANLYAVTWLAIEHCNGKLDIPAGLPPGTWRRGPENQFAMTGSEATLAQQRGKRCPANGQDPPHVASELVKCA